MCSTIIIVDTTNITIIVVNTTGIITKCLFIG
jgi:hypothetical protein